MHFSTHAEAQTDGADGANIDGLVAALAEHTSEFGPCHPQTLEIANILAAAFWSVGDTDETVRLLDEVVTRCTEHAGPNHPVSLAAKADLAAILSELGQQEEAALLEREAFDAAHLHLGRRHSVSSVLTWNRAARLEDRGDIGGAQRLVVNELSWLLTVDTASLSPEQTAIRAMLAQRVNWDGASTC